MKLENQINLEETRERLLDEAHYWEKQAQKYAGLGAFSLFNQCWAYYCRRMQRINTIDLAT